MKLGSNDGLRTKCQTEIQEQRESAAQRAVFFFVGQPDVTYYYYLFKEGLSGGCIAGLTLERCSQLAAFAIQPVG